MTREEAIRWLEDIHRRFNPTGEILENEGGDAHLQAIDMAIEALSAERTGEWKKAVIEKLESLEKYMENEIEDAKKHPENYTKNFIRCMEQQLVGVAHAAHEIIDMPSATERIGEWVPVKKVYRTNDVDFPNTHIEWETATCPDDVDAVRCSECGEVFDFADARNWCTECGAKMVGDLE